MEKTHAQYEEFLKASHAQNFPSTLKVTSSSEGFRVMDPFDWTLDKNIYQRWQLWSHKARLALHAMEGDNEKTKISYLHHWLDGKGISKIKGWRNSKTLISQAEYDALEERDRKGKYSLDKVESYFSLVENILTSRSNPLLAVEELHLTKQGSLTSEEFYSQVLEIVKRCRFPNQEAEERAVRDAIFIGINSQRARDKAINLMNEEGKEVTVEFLMNHLAVEDGNTQHRFLFQLDSNSSMNMVAYDRRQNRGKSNRAKNSNGREKEQNKSRVQTSSSTAQLSRKPPGMEGKCMRCGKPEHQQGEKCAAKNAKCKECHKIGHFYKVCQSSKKTRRANLAQAIPQDENDTHIDECGYTQPNPPVVNMLKVINHTGTTSGTQCLKFPIGVDPRGPYKHHIEVSIDTGADVNCMNEKTFKKLFPEVELSVCPHSIQNFGNSTADIYILGQFRTYLKYRGKKYLNTFVVTNANDCPNILSHGAIFRMGVDPRGPYKHHIEVSIDTGADVNCMNEKTFKKLFPEVELSVCPHSIQNFGNSTADIYILGQFRTYLKYRGKKYLNTFVVTNANDCPNILSHGAIFRMGVDPRGPYKHHIEVSIDTGADVNCMNEKTFKKLFPEVELSVCPHSIQNFGNSTADIYILGQFRTYLKYRGKKYLNTFVVTNANDCPNILSHGAIFRMGVLVPNYPEENIVKLGDQETGISNVFQILQDLLIKQYQGKSESKTHQPSTTFTTNTTRQPKVLKTHETASQEAGTATHIDNVSQIQTPYRTMPPPKTRTKANTSHSTRRPASGTHQFHSHSGPPTCCMHVHQQQSQTCKTGKLPALREVKHPHRDRTSVSRPPSTEQEVLSQFSGYSKEIEHLTRDPCKPRLKSCLQSTKHAFKKQEVNTYTDCEHSYRMEHAEHFPAPMEMCMDDHLTQTTERIQ